MLMGKFGKPKNRGLAMLPRSEQCALANASARAWFLFAMNSEILTERQRNRILTGISYL